MTSRSQRPGAGDRVGLSIGELASATGVRVATLRAWEERHGFPTPTRLPGGHRRYDGADVEVVVEVERRRAAGQTLPAAIAAARAVSVDPETSVYAGLRRRHPGLGPRTLRKATVLALTRAMEDECCARAAAPVLFGIFQRDHHYARSRDRWRELARTAETTVVFTDAKRPDEPARRLHHVAIEPGAPLAREWVLVCDAADHPACVVGWEVPGPAEVPDAERLFEVVWAVDPQVVRDAAQLCAELAGGADSLGLGARLTEAARPASADLRRAEVVLERTLAYVDRRSTG